MKNKNSHGNRIRLEDYVLMTSSHISTDFSTIGEFSIRQIIPLSKTLARPVFEDFTSPLIPPGSNRDDLISLLDGDIGHELSKCDVILQELERSEKTKIGPISVKQPFSYRYNSINHYFKSKVFRPNPEIFVRSVHEVIDLFPKLRLRTQDLDLVYKLSDKTTNWGAPEATTGDKSGLVHLEIAKSLKDNPRIPTYPSILGWRGQSSGTEIPKQRDVWMYPHSLILLELSFLHPLLPLLKEMDCFCMLKSVDSASVPITRMIDRALSTGENVIGFDASTFDKNCSRELIFSAFYVLKNCFQKQHHRLLDMLAIYFCESDILADGLLMTGRKGGVPSGSGFTNLIDSIIHLILFKYVSLITGKSNVGEECTVMGDDGVWFLPGLTPGKLSEILLNLGHEVNPSKVSYSNRHVTFCQRLFLDSYRSKSGVCYGIRSLYRTLNSMMGYERKPRISGVYDSCRWITQLEECKYHPLYKLFVRFTIARDTSYHLGLYRNGGPMDLFAEMGFEEFMKTRGKGFLYTSQVREVSDIPKLVTARYIVSLSRNRSV